VLQSKATDRDFVATLTYGMWIGVTLFLLGGLWGFLCFSPQSPLTEKGTAPSLDKKLDAVQTEPQEGDSAFIRTSERDGPSPIPINR